jgi:SAM-dependent methyltransferase
LNPCSIVAASRQLLPAGDEDIGEFVEPAHGATGSGERAKLEKRGRVFTKTARFYNAVYAAIGKDYASEARELKALIERMAPGARTLLDVGCGTGRHLSHFSGRFETHGIDADGEMVAIARQCHPTLDVQHGDMLTFSHDRYYDAITCLFGAIAYTRTIDRLNAAIANIARHLAPAGVLIVEPFVDARAYHPESFPAVFVDLPDLKIARMSVAKRVDARTRALYLGGISRGVSLGRHAFSRYSERNANADLRSGTLYRTLGAWGDNIDNSLWV